MSNKTSDKNVVTEEDLEVLNEVLLHNRETEQVRIAIEHILAEREQKDKRIQELEKERDHWHGCFIVAMENSIAKEKVIEAFEDIEDYFDRLNGPDEDIEYIKQIKQELLEGGK